MRRMAWLAACAAVVLTATMPSAQAPGQEKISGYAEWRWGADGLIADGQRVMVSPATTFKTKGLRRLADVPLGYEVEATGVRRSDGVLVATTFEAKQNGTALFEKDVRTATDDLEALWLRAGEVFEPDADGGRKAIGPLLESGPDVRRVRRILDRVTPPYLDRSALRLHVVDTKDWNAMAMGNGAIWVYTGLLHDMDDDEVAIVVGHELVHYSHEHTRREYKRAMWGQLLTLGALVVTEATVDNGKVKAAIAAGAVVTLLAVKNGYSRDLEDQADRVGLRYAYQAGYDVRKGPRLWLRFRDKYGDQNGLMNFFLGGHSQSSARVRNLEREIALNYSGLPGQR